MDRRDVRLLVGLAGASAALLLAFAAGAVGSELLYVAPVALLALPLLSGRYVGEQSIRRLASRRATRTERTAARPLIVSARPAARAFPRGGLLVAASLAERGPPARLAVR